MKSLIITVILLSANIAFSAPKICDAPFEGIVFTIHENDPSFNNERTIHVEYGSEPSVEILSIKKTIKDGARTTYLSNANKGSSDQALWLRSGSSISVTIDDRVSIINKSGLQAIGSAKFHLNGELLPRKEKLLCNK